MVAFMVPPQCFDSGVLGRANLVKILLQLCDLVPGVNDASVGEGAKGEMWLFRPGRGGFRRCGQGEGSLFDVLSLCEHREVVSLCLHRSEGSFVYPV